MKETNQRVALIHGCGSTLGKAIALEMAQWNVQLVLYDHNSASTMPYQIQSEVQSTGGEAIVLENHAVDGNGEAHLISAVIEKVGRLDMLINVFVPHLCAKPEEIYSYPAALLSRGLAAGKAIASSTQQGAIINHYFLPSMYAGTDSDEYMPMLKGAITGVTRKLCIKLGGNGIRVNGVLTGLLEMPETREIASPEVLKVKVPVGRWCTPQEVARLMSFLALKNRYMSGQSIIIDGGLTAGITGT